MTSAKTDAEAFCIVESIRPSIQNQKQQPSMAKNPSLPESTKRPVQNMLISETQSREEGDYEALRQAAKKQRESEVAQQV